MSRPMHLLWEILLCVFLTSGVRGGDTATVRPAATKHLVLDSRIVERVENARLAQGVVEKDSHNPLFAADKPWENALNNLYPNIVYDADARVFKLWYKCVLADKDAIAKMMPPATVHDVGWFLLYATSRDGITWEKPDLGLIAFDGSTHNNIVARDTPNVGVFKDDHDPDSSRRYKMVYDLGMGKIHIRFSPDGIHWSEKLAAEGMPATGDTHNNAFWDPSLGKYLLFTRQAPNHERTVFRSESSDFLKWSPPVLALHATPEEGKKRQAYCMPVYPYGDGYVGLVMMYNAGTDLTVDCELAWSPDSLNWARIFPGKPFIPRGPAGSYDAGCIYAQANPPVVQDGKMLIFFGGSTAMHKGWKRHCLPCLARLRPDGFACYEPEDAGHKAIVIAGPMRCTGQPLRVSVDAAGGSFRVGVVDQTGLGIDDCEPITGNVTDGLVRWKGSDIAGLKGKTVRLRFELDRAKIYAFDGVERIVER